jgi:hypothetical protein
MWRWHVIYRWKTLNKGYNFVLGFTSIRGLHKKIWASKVVGVLILKFSKLPTWESQDKMTFGCKPYDQLENIIRGKVMASPKFGLW